jgi:hypothetical protein
MSGDEQRVTLEWLKHNLREDPNFPGEALLVLQRVDPQSTHTIATSAESLVEWWLTERELKCYERGVVVADTTTVTLYADDTGSTDAAERAIELMWRVDRLEFVLLLERYNLTIPKSLRLESPPKHGGPNEMGYSVEEAAAEIFNLWGVHEAEMQERIREAAERGELEFIDPMTGLPFVPTERRDFYERISTSKLNAWFEAKGVKYRLRGGPEPAETHTSGNTKAPPIESGQTSGTAVKRRVLLQNLSQKYPRFDTAIRTNEREFSECRVPKELAPGKKGGYYYQERVEAVCAAKWPTSEETHLGSVPAASGLGNWGIRNGKKFSNRKS